MHFSYKVDRYIAHATQLQGGSSPAMGQDKEITPQWWKVIPNYYKLMRITWACDRSSKHALHQQKKWLIMGALHQHLKWLILGALHQQLKWFVLGALYQQFILGVLRQ